MSEDALLTVERLTKRYASSTGLLSRLLGDDGALTAVDDVSLRVGRGEVVGVVGESGSGKSTLAETILRLEEPTAGTVTFDGEEVTALSSSELRAFRERAQIVFQDPYETLDPRQTVLRAVAEPLENFRDHAREARRRIVAETLEDVGLRPPETYLDAYPDQLSGGQRQRVNLARAVVLEPDLLVADEPVSMLDASLQAGVIRMLDRLRRERDFSVLYVSHDLSTVRLLADRVAVMYRGRVVERGPADRVLEAPRHPYTRALVASVPTVDGDRERVRLPRPDRAGDISGCRFHPRCPDAMAECRRADPALAPADGRDVACFLHHDERRDESSEGTK